MTFKHFLSGLFFLGVFSFHVSAATEDDAEQAMLRGAEYYLAEDYSQARDLFQLAAEQGHPSAQLMLGSLYSHGFAVPQNDSKAWYWYEKAAAQDDVRARYNLGVIYFNGLGVRQNLTTAKEWFGKACDGEFQQGCVNYRVLNQKGL